MSEKQPIRRVSRPHISNCRLSVAMQQFKARLTESIAKHGSGALVSLAEAYGVCAEELNKEALEAMHAGDVKQFRSEMHDLAVAALFAWASFTDADDPKEKHKEQIRKQNERFP